MRFRFPLRSVLMLWSISLAMATCSLTTVSFGDDWPTFRGPNRTSVSDKVKLTRKWPEGGPKKVWEGVGAGRGYSSLAIAGESIYTLGDGLSTADDADEYLTCFDRNSGKQRWKLKTGPAWNEGDRTWQGSRSTPTVSDGMVYVITPKGVLVCSDANNGKLLWTKDLVKEFGGEKADSWGYSESPLVDGPHVVCTPGGKNTMVKLDKKTGELVWKASRKGDIGAGHASIVITKVGNKSVYVQTTGSGGLGVDAANGTVLWEYPIDKTIAVIPTPVVKDDLVFIVAGYGRGGALVQQIPRPDGAVSIQERYGLNTKLANKHGGVILIGDHLYGDSDDKGLPFCAALKTGEITWKNRGPGSRSAVVIGGDGLIFIQFQDGLLVVAEANPSEFKEVGRFTIPGSGKMPSWTHPVILDGKLYVREQDTILCYDIAA